MPRRHPDIGIHLAPYTTVQRRVETQACSTPRHLSLSLCLQGLLPLSGLTEATRQPHKIACPQPLEKRVCVHTCAWTVYCTCLHVSSYVDMCSCVSMCGHEGVQGGRDSGLRGVSKSEGSLKRPRRLRERTTNSEAKPRETHLYCTHENSEPIRVSVFWEDFLSTDLWRPRQAIEEAAERGRRKREEKERAEEARPRREREEGLSFVLLLFLS